jgi:hypothetical protein
MLKSIQNVPVSVAGSSMSWQQHHIRDVVAERRQPVPLLDLHLHPDSPHAVA